MSVPVLALPGSAWSEQTTFLLLIIFPPTANYISVSCKMWKVIIPPQRAGNFMVFIHTSSNGNESHTTPRDNMSTQWKLLECEVRRDTETEILNQSQHSKYHGSLSVHKS